MTEIYYRHGSADSQDADVLVVIPFQALTTEECREMCAKFEQELAEEFPFQKVDVNLISIKDKKVVWCFKGLVDEVNNGLIFTYPLFDQKYDLLVRNRVVRNKEAKIHVALRTILTFLSRSKHRDLIKQALKQGDIEFMSTILKTIDFSEINPNDFEGKNVDISHFIKKTAFQIAQTTALINGKELYTKRSLSDLFPLLEESIYDLGVSDHIKLRNLNFYKDSLISLL